jgi:hypothetical protein
VESPEPALRPAARTYVIRDRNFPDRATPAGRDGQACPPIKLIVVGATVAEPATSCPVGRHGLHPTPRQSVHLRRCWAAWVRRFGWPDGREDSSSSTVRPAAGRGALTFGFAVRRTSARLVLGSPRDNHDARDTVGWEPTNRLFVARDTGHPWFSVWGATGSADARPVADPPPIGQAAPVSAASATPSRSLPAVPPPDLRRRGLGIHQGRGGRDLAPWPEPRSLLAEKQGTTSRCCGLVTIPDRRQAYNWVIEHRVAGREVPGIGAVWAAG